MLGQARRQQNTYADIFGNHISGSEGFVLQQNGGQINEFTASCGVAGGGVMTPIVQLTAGRWQHVALVKTRTELRVYLNGVQLVAQPAPGAAVPSPLSIRVGLGFNGAGRCFRGLIEGFRIWNRAFAKFDHAGIDPAAAQETRSQYLDDTPRPAAGAAVRSWTWPPMTRG